MATPIITMAIRLEKAYFLKKFGANANPLGLALCDKILARVETTHPDLGVIVLSVLILFSSALSDIIGVFNRDDV